MEAPVYLRRVMENLNAYTVLLTLCGLIVLSYLFSVVSRATRIPSVLLLLATGIGLRSTMDVLGFASYVPTSAIEILGTIGLIMIVLEAGLDLTVSRDRWPLIRSALFSGTVVFLLSTLAVAGVLQWWIPAAPFISCIVYAIPLSIVSSAIVMPSIQHLSHQKREFLIYEVAVSDVIGIMVFNFFTAGETVGWHEVIWFGSSIVVALIVSVLVCFGLMLLLVKNRINVKFFLVFAVLIIIYIGGKMLHLPSLLTILMFGMVIHNWELVRWPPVKKYFSDASVNHIAGFLKSITSESAFLIRTIFFVIFGYNIQLNFLGDREVVLIGGSIVLILFTLRFVYLRVLNRYNLIPALFYIPRGLITVLLFYKIPTWQRIEAFHEGVLFFVILSTSLIMMIGSLVYHDRPVEISEPAPPSTE